MNNTLARELKRRETVILQRCAEQALGDMEVKDISLGEFNVYLINRLLIEAKRN